MYEDIRYETETGTATITINRPDVHNAFRQQTVLELNEALREARKDGGVYTIILTGTGESFCAGADITDMPNWDEMSKEDYAGYLWSVQNIVRQLRGLSKPSIAAVSGPAIGAGCDFALACDMRVVGPDALFREGFVRVGLIPGDGGAWLLPRLIGESAAKKYLLTGRDISPADAVDLGLAVEQADDALEAAYDLTEELLALPATAVQRTNQLIDSEQKFENYCERAIEYQWECVNDPEHHEAVAAFNDKREPSYDRDYN